MVVTQQELWPRIIQEVEEKYNEKIIAENLNIRYTNNNFTIFFKQIKFETWPEDRAGKDAKEKQ